MKKALLLIYLVAVSIIDLSAQTHLVNALTPKESFFYECEKFKGANTKVFSTLEGKEWSSGFTLGNNHKENGFATFDLDGKYETLLFDLGRELRPYSINDETTIITVTLDGRKVLDELVYTHSVTKPIRLDVSGVKELKFTMVQGSGHIAFAEPTLWKAGQTPPQRKNNTTSLPNILHLGRDLKPYYMKGNFYNIASGESYKSVEINRQEFTDGIAASMKEQLLGNSEGWAYFYTQKAYSKLSFLIGPITSGSNKGEGWIAIKADGKVIYEKLVHYDDIAERVTIDISGCDVLSFSSEGTKATSYIGIFEMMAYKDGVTPKTTVASEDTVDPRLRSLPDACKLMSNIPPYAAGSGAKKQIFNGESDYITFSMGGVKFSEGIVLYETANFLDDAISAYAIFDLGNEFDYLYLTAGYIGKSGAMTNDRLRVYADDELVLDEPMMATQPNVRYRVPIHKCRRLRIANRGSSMMSVGAFGVADLVVYRGEPKEDNLFYHPQPECPPTIDLIDLGAPYIHYVSGAGDKKFYDGTTKRNYFDLNGEQIYKGFLLKTSVHFSLDFGIFYNEEEQSGGTTSAAAATVGATAVGAAFVAGGAAVGGAIVGSTLAGVAPMLMLAAGGTALETSCAAFNTYGEYQSVTFTVACYQPNDDPSDFKENLLIGADHNIVAEFTVYESMEPQTITVPINGCGQLLFWLANSGDNSAKYLFYDISLSKESVELDIPEDARLSNAIIKEFEYSEKEVKSEWDLPKSSGQKNVDEYLRSITHIYRQTKDLIERCEKGCSVATHYLAAENNQVYKAVYISDTQYILSMTNEYNDCCRTIENLKELRSQALETKIALASASLGLPELGFNAIHYGKLLKKGSSVLKECGAILEVLYNEKMDETQFFKTVLDSAIDIDGKTSTEDVVLCPLFPGEEAPHYEKLQLVRNFSVKDKY